MPIFRILDPIDTDNTKFKIMLLDLGDISKELEFIKNNPDYDYRFVDSLPVNYQYTSCLIYDKINDKIDIDIDCVLKEKKQELIQQINILANEFITKILSDLDWGKTYEECSVELQSSLVSLENKVLYELKKYDNTISLTKLHEDLIPFVIDETKTINDIETYVNSIVNNNTANSSNTATDTANNTDLVNSIKELVNVSRLIYWKDNIIWKYVEDKEKEINNVDNIDALVLNTEIDSTDISKPGIQFILGDKKPKLIQ